MSTDSAFDAWVSENRLFMLRYAAADAPVSDREDLVQDTLARAWLKRDTFDEVRGSPRVWLLAIMADLARQRWRTRGPLVAHPPSEAMRDPPPSINIDVRRAVDDPPVRQREVTVLYYYVDLTMASIAVLLGCSEGTVKSSLHDARRRLSSTLKDYDD